MFIFWRIKWKSLLVGIVLVLRNIFKLTSKQINIILNLLLFANHDPIITNLIYQISISFQMLIIVFNLIRKRILLLQRFKLLSHMFEIHKHTVTIFFFFISSWIATTTLFQNIQIVNIVRIILLYYSRIFRVWIYF